ncbi:protein of unknown function [Rhodovastum atsumiense]|nr:protein of unknown function [Rhodovastum atsumiense]
MTMVFQQIVDGAGEQGLDGGVLRGGQHPKGAFDRWIEMRADPHRADPGRLTPRSGVSLGGCVGGFQGLRHRLLIRWRTRGCTTDIHEVHFTIKCES